LPRRLKIAAAALLLTLIGTPSLLLLAPRPLLGLLAEAHPEVLFYVETERPLIALTLDDGPDPELTPRILDLLAEHDAHATFFLIGERVPGNEKLLERMRAEGHELGNHLDRDEPSISLTAAQFESQLLHTDSLLTRAGGEGSGGGKWCRPGSGWFNERMVDQLAGQGYRLALGSVYPHDLLLKSPRLIAEFVLNRVRAGSVLILHDGDGDPDRTLRVLGRVLPELKARGFEIGTLTELTAPGN
jgi:peptidoglycan-N-acetylglucosamine deacetylase